MSYKVKVFLRDSICYVFYLRIISLEDQLVCRHTKLYVIRNFSIRCSKYTTFFAVPYRYFYFNTLYVICYTSYVNTSILQPSVALTFSSIKYRNRMKLSNEWFSIFIYILKFRNNHAERNGSRGYYAAIVYDLSSPRLPLLIFQIAKTIAGETLNYGDCLRGKKYVLSYKEATRDDR